MQAIIRVLSPVVIATVLGALSSSHVQASVDLAWRPLQQNVAVGETAEIALYAVSDNSAGESISVIEAIVVWSAARLRLLGHVQNGPYAWLEAGFNDDSRFDGLNAPFLGLPDNDGDALYTARSQLGGPAAIATTDGLLVATLQFEVLVPGTSELVLASAYGASSVTRVISGSVPGLEITGTLGPPAVVTGGEMVPTLSEVGLVLTATLMLVAGSAILRSRGSGRRTVEDEFV